VLGLVTMDDLLAQIFGAMRDERADLQASMPGIKAQRSRTPASGIDTSPISKVEPEPEPVSELDNAALRSVLADPINQVIPIHAPEDEVTPPAHDIDELQAGDKS